MLTACGRLKTCLKRRSVRWGAWPSRLCSPLPAWQCTAVRLLLPAMASLPGSYRVLLWHKCAGPVAPGTKAGAPYMATNVLLDAWVTMCLAHPGDLPNQDLTMSLLRAAGDANRVYIHSCHVLQGTCKSWPPPVRCLRLYIIMHSWAQQGCCVKPHMQNYTVQG